MKGCKQPKAQQITDSVFKMVNDILRQRPVNSNQSNSDAPELRSVTTSVPTFKQILEYCLNQNEFQKPDCMKDFLVASLLMQQKVNVIVLLAGTSGTGKSTLASLLGTRLGISTVLSTDSIRHIMRNFLKQEDHPILFCSTYEAGQLAQVEDRTKCSENLLTRIGYKQQAALVQKELAKVIE